MSTDRIEKKVHLKAKPSRVWRALTVPAELGHWFGGRFQAKTFEPGARVEVRHAPTQVDPDVAKKQEEALKEWGDRPWYMLVERVEPERLFSFRWHPAAIDPKKDYSDEPTTLVEFTLEEKDGGTLLTVVESGFDELPAERRAKAFQMNGEGWGYVAKILETYVASS